MPIRSRRSFLQTAGTTAAALSLNSKLGWSQSVSPVRVWSSYRDKRHAPAAPLTWSKPRQISAEAVVLDPTTTKQEILGFGAAMTDAACYVLSQMTDAEREAVMHDIFSPGEMAMNVCRTCIGASDYARNVYSFDDSDTPDPELKKFSIDHDKAYILPVLREARKHNPELFLFSSPWSPPAWMKPDKTMLGGTMRASSLPAYAQYFVKFLQAYKSQGVPIDAVTIQNETDAEQGGRMPACVWAQEMEMEFAARHLGPALRSSGLDTRLWILDHNYSLWGRVLDELSDPAVYAHVDGIAWHGYVGEPSAMTRVHQAFPAKPSYWTEGGPDITQPDYETDFANWSNTFNGVLNNWARSITAWNLALDEHGKPNIGPFSCGGVITIQNSTIRDASHTVKKSGQYWAFAHLSRHIKRGAKVFATNGVVPDAKEQTVTCCAALNPDGTHVLVVANRGPQTRRQFVLGETAIDLDLPAQSVHTLEWRT